MANQQYPVEVQPDFLKKITGAKPVQALAELVWNGLDADVSEVVISFDYSELDSLPGVIVRDNAMGIPSDRAPEYSRRLGGSWKRLGAATQRGRFLHGQRAVADSRPFDRRLRGVVGGLREEWKALGYKITMSAAEKIDSALRLSRILAAQQRRATPFYVCAERVALSMRRTSPQPFIMRTKRDL